MKRYPNTTPIILVLLLIEFLDELVFGAGEAAWPLIRTDLGLSYVHIGLLLSLPGIASSLVEPVIGILGDVGKRRLLVLGGGLLFALSLSLTALSNSFLPLLISFVLLYPAAGAFVSLSQATLMDVDPQRHELNMARWVLAGSVGLVLGPLALSGARAAGWGWRGAYLSFAGITLLVWLFALPLPFQGAGEKPASPSFWQGAKISLQALGRREVLRWLTLLEFSDLMLDVLLGFLALYLVDAAGTTPGQAAAAVAVWTGGRLLGGLLLLPLLKRVRGLSYLRVSAAVELALFPAFLLLPGYEPKLVLLALLGFFNAGWYSILQAQLYSAMPGQSGAVMTVGNVFGLVGGLIPLGLGWIAECVDLQAAMWLLLLGPAALLVGIPLKRVRDR
ncbi:MAG: MFS transporter [Anaerolineae bacterium]|nr:MFS transporter [Anaerolineae bacterium]